MITEKSCGAVVFTMDSGCVQYVIVKSVQGHFGFPKGHVEIAETEAETALREIQEETGLIVNLFDGFKAEDSYTFLQGSEIRTKHVIYFLAEYSNQTPNFQEEELNSVYVMSFEDALSILQFDSAKRILTEANAHLEQYLSAP